METTGPGYHRLAELGFGVGWWRKTSYSPRRCLQGAYPCLLFFVARALVLVPIAWYKDYKKSTNCVILYNSEDTSRASERHVLKSLLTTRRCACSRIALAFCTECAAWPRGNDFPQFVRWIPLEELKRIQAESAAELERLEGAILARAFRGEL